MLKMETHDFGTTQDAQDLSRSSNEKFSTVEPEDILKTPLWNKKRQRKRCDPVQFHSEVQNVCFCEVSFTYIFNNVNIFQTFLLHNEDSEEVDGNPHNNGK